MLPTDFESRVASTLDAELFHEPSIGNGDRVRPLEMKLLGKVKRQLFRSLALNDFLVLKCDQIAEIFYGQGVFPPLFGVEVPDDSS